MITEDYVSFEVAKLLKEKGFDWECIGYYVDYEPDDVKYSLCGETNSIWESRCCSAPTLQMAMKWLREICEIFIEIPIYSITKPILYRWNAFKNGKLVTDEEIPKNCNYTIKGDENNPTIYYYRYEEACEKAIKYCLTNLI